MSDIILSGTGSAFKSETAAKAARTKFKAAGMETVIEPVEGQEGMFVLRKVQTQEPEEEIQQDREENESAAPISTLADLQDGDVGRSDDTHDRRPPRHKRERNRIPLGSQGPLYIAAKYKDPNYVERFVNDKPGRIDSFMRAGYEMVCVAKDNQIVGDPHCGRAGKVGTPVTKTGENETMYLMRIKREWYEEDQAVKQKRNVEIEEEIEDQQHKKGRYGKVEFGR